MTLLLFVLLVGVGCGKAPMQTNEPLDESLEESEVNQSVQVVSKCGLNIDCGGDNGLLEFCVSKNETTRSDIETLLGRALDCMNSGGRAQCDLDTEILCFIQSSTRCNSNSVDRQAFQDEICSVHSHPKIRELVPTFFE